jgi:large subunit ribosomal protein L21
MLVDGEEITVGTPTVDGIQVSTTVKEHFKGPKLIIFKYSPKKRIRVKGGHRQQYTRLMVDAIGKSKATKAKKAATPAEKTETKAEKKVEKKEATAAKPAAKKTKKTPAKKAPAKKAEKAPTKKTTTKETATKKASSTETTKK